MRLPRVVVTSRVLIFSLSGGLLFWGLATQNEQPQKAIKQLEDAKVLVVHAKVKRGDKTSDETLTYQTPNKLKIETYGMLTISDGATLWSVDKSKNTYTEAKASTKPALADEVLCWQAFFVNDPFKNLTFTKSAQKVEDKSFDGYATKLTATKSLTLLIDPQSGSIEGEIVQEGDQTTTVVATEVKTDGASVTPATFAFVPPSGATKIETPTPAAGTYARVDQIMQQYCTGCHGGDGPRGGLSLTGYEELMAGGSSGKPVVPGDSADSLLYQYITGTLKPRMPMRSDPLSSKEIEDVKAWIDAGAKSK